MKRKKSFNTDDVMTSFAANVQECKIRTKIGKERMHKMSYIFNNPRHISILCVAIFHGRTSVFAYLPIVQAGCFHR